MAVNRLSGPANELCRRDRRISRACVSAAASQPAADRRTQDPTGRGRGMKRLREVDAVIIGGGWNGLLMAKELAARTSLSVVVLERGGPRKTSDYVAAMDELDYGIRLKMMQDVSQETVTFRHTPRDRALPLRQHGSFLPGSGVGGAGEHWSGISYRYVPDAFDLHTRTLEKYGAKRLPEKQFIQDRGHLHHQ